MQNIMPAFKRKCFTDRRGKLMPEDDWFCQWREDKESIRTMKEKKRALVLRWKMRRCVLGADIIFVFGFMCTWADPLCSEGYFQPLRHQRRGRGTGVCSGCSPHQVSDEVFHASHSEHHDQRDHADVPRYRWDGRDTLQTGKRTHLDTKSLNRFCFLYKQETEEQGGK